MGGGYRAKRPSVVARERQAELETIKRNAFREGLIVASLVFLTLLTLATVIN